MSPLSHDPRTGNRIAALLVSIVLSICAISAVLRHTSFEKPIFWDTKVYSGAMQALAHNENPYAKGVLVKYDVPAAYNFTSPPIVRSAFVQIENFGLRSVVLVIIKILCALSMVVTPYLAWKIFRSSDGNDYTEFALAFTAYHALFAFGGTVAGDTGNYGTIFNMGIMAAVWWGSSRHKWLPFHVIVCLATATKPFYAAMWIIPVLYRDFNFRQALTGSVFLAVSLCSYIYYYVFDNAVFSAWLDGLSTQLILYADHGRNLYGAVIDLLPGTGNGPLPMIAQLAMNALLLFFAFRNNLDSRQKLALLMITATFLNPRVMVYDASLAAVPVMLLASALFGRIPSRVFRQCAALAILFFCSLLTLRSVNILHMGLCFALTVIAVSAGTIYRTSEKRNGKHFSRATF